jgi:ubiquinone/menaquinone biosynthesis C-methylase UbiE
MSNRSTQSTGTIPEEYDRRIGPVLFAEHAEIVARRVASFHPERVLETAAGTGIATRRLRDLLSESTELVATDVDPAMLAIARNKFEPRHKVQFQQVDATNLPYPDSSFDVVTCQFGVMFFADKDRSYREAQRVLRRGGRYVFSVWDSLQYNHPIRIIREIIVGLLPIDQAYDYSAIDPIKESLLSAGFGDIRIDIVSLQNSIPDPEDFAFGMVHARPMIAQAESRGVDTDQIVDAVAAALRKELSATGTLLTQSILFEATAQ